MYSELTDSTKYEEFIIGGVRCAKFIPGKTRPDPSVRFYRVSRGEVLDYPIPGATSDELIKNRIIYLVLERGWCRGVPYWSESGNSMDLIDELATFETKDGAFINGKFFSGERGKKLLAQYRYEWHGDEYPGYVGIKSRRQ
jgi:hypothetical protein